VQVRLAVPDPVRLAGVSTPHVMPIALVSVSETVPLNWLSPVTVMIVVAGWVVSTGDGVVAVIVKSWNVNVAVAEWDRFPLVPVTVRVYVPAVVELHETVAVPEPVTLVGVNAPQFRPEGIVSENVTVPAKPLSPVTVKVELAD
jgi:hypothetical protein